MSGLIISGDVVSLEDALKEEISFNKFLLGFLLAFTLSVGGWISQHYTDNSAILWLAVIAEIIVAFGSGILIYRIRKAIKQLEKI